MSTNRTCRSDQDRLAERPGARSTTGHASREDRVMRLGAPSNEVSTCLWWPLRVLTGQSIYPLALRRVRVVAVGVALSNRAVLLVDQVLDAVLLRRCATGRLRLSLGVVRTRSALSILAAVGPPILGRHRVDVLLVAPRSSTTARAAPLVWRSAEWAGYAVVGKWAKLQSMNPESSGSSSNTRAQAPSVVAQRMSSVWPDSCSTVTSTV
jgi:hypothetical protein